MNLSFVRIDRGGLDRERLVLKASADTDLGNYVIFVTRHINDDDIASAPVSVLWLPDRNLKRGDFVRVNTRAGTTSQTKNRSGTMTHEIYWGQRESVWSDPTRRPTLLEINEWGTFDEAEELREERSFPQPAQR